MKESSLPDHIILIDDDAVTNMVNKKIIYLSFPSIRVTAYTDAAVALDQLRQMIAKDVTQLPDLIFLDINMPHMDGWEFLNEFIKLSESALQKTKIVMLTSSVDINDIEKSKTYKPVTDFLSKPLNKDNLRNLLQYQSV
ncbi:response regulator [Ohtaekwangia kribbensis]|jgi:CheY-like chemotaxis protein|uniref:Response regulator n=1 Tax=Ohtaekwangia kribbensis TaxID=688913 RepID=A0ABW3K491_9BACT